MINKRVIARLDIKSPNLVKGIHLEGLRKLGNPHDYAVEYYKQGVDEIIYMDIVASLYERNSLLSLIEETSADVFIPITVGGGIRTLDDIAAALRVGADKVAINTAAIKNPQLIKEASTRFGSQCIVVSVETAHTSSGVWEAMYDNGRERSGRDVKTWCLEVQSLGAGEILLTSIDMEGTGRGFDLELVHSITTTLDIPVISCGGMGELTHLNDLFVTAKADAVAMANVLHYKKYTLSQIRSYLLENNISVRDFDRELQWV